MRCFTERFRAAQGVDLEAWFAGMARLQPHPEMVFAISGLRRRGLRIGAVTNYEESPALSESGFNYLLGSNYLIQI